VLRTCASFFADWARSGRAASRRPAQGSSLTTDAATRNDTYEAALADYLRTHGEAALYRASLLSQRFVEAGTGPEEIVAMHGEALAAASAKLGYREQARAASDGLHFLLEVMIAYGLQYREHIDLRFASQQREAEARSAADQARLAAAEQSLREKGEVLAEVAHELRTPLTAAKGNLDLLKRQADRGQFDRIGHYADTAVEAMGRLLRLTRNLDAASRDELTVPAEGPVDLCATLRRAYEWAVADAADKGVELVYDEALEALSVSGDEDALLSVLGNLFSNAIRYTPTGGRVVARCLAEGPWAVVEVVDTGIGIAPEDQARVFEKFFRASAARQADPRGLGLGLALVDRLTRAHGGRVELTSTPGEGSTFRVLLPRSAD
jgi:two-component system OmpR family sensor kinase